MERALDELLRASAGDPGAIGLAGGLPSDGLFPRRALARSFLRVLQQPPTLQYGWPEGHLPLREQIAERLRARGAEVTADEVLVTSGAQQAIAIAVELVAKPGDDVRVDGLTYPSALDLFRTQGLRPATVAMGGHARVRYAMPAVHNPSGAGRSHEQRRALIASAEFVIEDDAYADLLFAGPAPRPLLADAPARTFHVGTFSKILCPGLRIGWLVVPTRFQEEARSLKSAADLQSGSLAQLLLSDYLGREDLDQRLPRLRRFYRARRKAGPRASRPWTLLAVRDACGGLQRLGRDRHDAIRAGLPSTGHRGRRELRSRLELPVRRIGDAARVSAVLLQGQPLRPGRGRAEAVARLGQAAVRAVARRLGGRVQSLGIAIGGASAERDLRGSRGRLERHRIDERAEARRLHDARAR